MELLHFFFFFFLQSPQSSEKVDFSKGAGSTAEHAGT